MTITKEEYDNYVTEVMAKQGGKIADIVEDNFSVALLIGVALSDAMCGLKDLMFKEEK